MKQFILYTSLSITLLISASCVRQQDNKNCLWYEQPANEWMEALPIGNGRLAAMVYGGVENEIVALNESSVWSGNYNPNQNKPFGGNKLAKLRELFFEGKIAEGNHIASHHLYGNFDTFGTHLPVGDLLLNFSYPEGKISGYRRTLDMENGITEVSFNVGNTHFKREYLASNPDDVILIRLSASQANSLNFTIATDLLRQAKISSQGNTISFSGKVSFHLHGSGGVNFMGSVGVQLTDGTLSAENGTLQINDATDVLLAIDIRTDYKQEAYANKCLETVQAALSQPYDKSKAAHTEDFSALFSRVGLFLGKSRYEHLPTDKRWQQVKDGAADTGLDALLFQYGRYLLISSSRENSPLPANLQGIWNDNLACHMGWTCDYHLDINTEQNYWIANVGNLAECHIPLFNYIKDLSMYGSVTARQVYGCRGWTAHTVANIWGHTAPSQSIYWGLFPTAGSWIASHLWTQYSYTQDIDFLRNEAYPLLKGNAQFLLDFLIENPHNGYLMTGPSISPENSFLLNGSDLPASMMPACDRQLVYEIFNYCIQSAEILDVDKEFADKLKAALKKLPPIQISSNGAIQEWFEDYEEAHPNHRHTSHLLALYPFNQITVGKTPDLARAAQKTIEYRLAAEGWEDTEWSRANMICFYARLKDATEAYKSLQMLINDFTRENLMTISPEGIAGAPYDIFILDGNTAGSAGMAEMLLQAQEGYIELLPTLPPEWRNGSFKGLCVPGGGEMSAEWKNAKIKKASLKATATGVFKIKLPNYNVKFNFTKNGQPVVLSANSDQIITISLAKGDIFMLSK